MRVLALLNSDKVFKLKAIEEHFAEYQIILDIIIYKAGQEEFCIQREEIFAAIGKSEILVFFASDKINDCLKQALVEANRLGRKIICIQEDEGDVLADGFTKFGDGLVHQVSEVLDQILATPFTDGWTNVDSSIKEDGPFARHKCGNKK
ncbi:hypothetical protein [Phytopseudomonas flavescens]|uniref:hypothetical protein n=1 Tax=Phytopseudomonas flavescens TaxID=29435 RepID=UPI000A03A060|nr:hypothetical protein [Pseudomonas flavescens]